jgi:hypothetical protein
VLVRKCDKCNESQTVVEKDYRIKQYRLTNVWDKTIIFDFDLCISCLDKIKQYINKE